MAKRSTSGNSPAPLFETLEPRLLLSAEGLGAVVADAGLDHDLDPPQSDAETPLLQVDDSEQTESAALSRLTDADVAGSDDITGNALLGGDWDLEYRTGTVETAIALHREMRSDWQAVLATASFQEGVSSYAGTQDTYIDEANPGAANGNVSKVLIQNQGPGWEYQGLIPFDDIFAGAGGPIPDGATINSATLEVEVVSNAGGSTNITLHRMQATWDESSSWNSPSLGGNGGKIDSEALATVDATISDVDGPHTINTPGLAATL